MVDQPKRTLCGRVIRQRPNRLASKWATVITAIAYPFSVCVSINCTMGHMTTPPFAFMSVHILSGIDALKQLQFALYAPIALCIW